MLFSHIAMAALAALPLSLAAPVATSTDSASAASTSTPTTANGTATAKAEFLFPKASDWWVLDTLNTAAWNWTNFQPQSELTVVISNNNSALGINGNETSAAWMSALPSGLVSVGSNAGSYLNGAHDIWLKPGTGYVLTLLNSNLTTVYAVSDAFEVKSNTSSVDPEDPTHKNSSTTNSTGATSSGTASSGAHVTAGVSGMGLAVGTVVLAAVAMVV